jgi:hypothetical protein
MRLRASQQLALMRLGVSSIIPADLSDAAAKRMLDALQGTRFMRAYDIDAQQVDEDTAGLLRRAVTNAASFCDVVERLLAAADDFEIDSCLVRLQFAGAEPARVLHIARRLGRDLVAFAHRDCAFLFVFGCPKRMAPAMLERLFRSETPGVCTNWSSEHDPERIFELLGELRETTAEPASSDERASAPIAK